MVFAGQLRRELAAAEAGRGPGRPGRVPGPGGAHVPAGGFLGPDGPGPVAPAPEPRGAGGVPAGDGPAPGPPGVSAQAPFPVPLVPAAGRRIAPAHPEPGGPLDRRRPPGHGAPAGGHLRPVPAAAPRPRRPPPRSTGIRGTVPATCRADGGPRTACPHRFRGLGEPADGAPLGPAGGAGGGGGAAPRTAPCGGGAGDRGGGQRHGGGVAGTGARARVRGRFAPAAGGFSGAAPRGGAP